VLLGGARALLFPIDWPSRSAWWVIEALLVRHAGAGVARGSDAGTARNTAVTAGLVDSIDAVRRVAAASGRDRPPCVPRRLRAAVHGRSGMARDYVNVYQQLRTSSRDRLEARSA
jgi:hypothetical protein